MLCQPSVCKFLALDFRYSFWVFGDLANKRCQGCLEGLAPPTLGPDLIFKLFTHIIEPNAFSHIESQVCGTKMIVAASIYEIMEYFGVNSLSEARDRFQALAASDLPPPNSGLGARGHFYVMMRLLMTDDSLID